MVRTYRRFMALRNGISSIARKSFLLTALICGPFIKLLLCLYKRTWLGRMVLCLCRRSIAYLRNLFSRCTGTNRKKSLEKKSTDMSTYSSDEELESKNSSQLEQGTLDSKTNSKSFKKYKNNTEKFPAINHKVPKATQINETITLPPSKTLHGSSKSGKSDLVTKSEISSESKQKHGDLEISETVNVGKRNDNSPSSKFLNNDPTLPSMDASNQSSPIQGTSNIETIVRKRPHAKSKRQKKNLKRKERKRSKLDSELPEEGFELSDSYSGNRRGIEGSMNSCYMDSLLFSMFYTANIFDSLMITKETDDEFAKTTRSILNKSVVKPLKEVRFCNSAGVMKLRQHLSPLDQDIMGAFMDAGQLLYILCQQALKEKEFIQYSAVNEDTWGDFMHLMCTDESDGLDVITVQQNMEQSLKIFGDLIISQVPTPSFILGTPRSNRILIKYQAVIPNVTLDIRKVMQTAPCKCCKKAARWEAHEEISASQVNVTFLCNAHAKTFKTKESTRILSRERMRLRSIACIRGVHFVAFTYRQTEACKIWYFFDSMAGGSSEVKTVPNMEQWLIRLAAEPAIFYTEQIPYYVKRSLTDGHLCIYEPVVFGS